MIRDWRSVGTLPADAVPVRVASRPDGSGFIYTRTAVYEVHDDVSPRWAPPGPIDAADGAWFVSKGSLFHDGKPVGHVPPLRGIVVAGSDVYGLAEGLLRLRNGTWTPIDSPARGDWEHERVWFTGSNLVLGTPRGLFVLRDGDRGWAHHEVDGGHVRAIAVPFVAARRDDNRIHIGRLGPTKVDWLGKIEAIDAVKLSVAILDSRREMQILCYPADQPDLGLCVIETVPGGGFAASGTKAPLDPAWGDISGARGALIVTRDRKVVTARPAPA